MPDALGRLYARDVAEMTAIPQDDWRARVSRGHAPAPAARVEANGTLHNVWDPVVIDAYLHRREVRQSGDPLPRGIECPHTECDAIARTWPELTDHVQSDHSREP